ncbi:MAG: AbrB/MazE/SpoVT family DNA-binding domain-containing protein [Candidatus Aenigmarchaeota archaeon]|nr:AbrB/MazE/SpoVT family DNA-binding domain-containing protein [Candidatus Aenigmarchaeota archaeon]
MGAPTKRSGNQKQGLVSSRCVFSSRIDEKGRIVIPAPVRATLGLGKGTKVKIELSVLASEIIFRIDKGCSGVMAGSSRFSTEDCGSSRPDSKSLFFGRKTLESSGCGPENDGGVLNERK